MVFFFIFKHSWVPKRSWKISHGVPGKSWKSPGFSVSKRVGTLFLIYISSYFHCYCFDAVCSVNYGGHSACKNTAPIISSCRLLTQVNLANFVVCLCTL